MTRTSKTKRTARKTAKEPGRKKLTRAALKREIDAAVRDVKLGKGKDEDIILRDPDEEKIFREAEREEARQEREYEKKGFYRFGRRTSRDKKKAERSSLWGLLSVEAIATDPIAREYIKRYVHASLDMPHRHLRHPRPRGESCVVHLPVTAEIRIMAYLTSKVPRRLRVKRVKVKTVGEMLIAGAKMYAEVYAEDERLGGESREAREARQAKERKRDPKTVHLLNRTEGPYVWGHDMCDLVFEGICVKWTGPRSCIVYFEIGS